MGSVRVETLEIWFSDGMESTPEHVNSIHKLVKSSYLC